MADYHILTQDKQKKSVAVIFHIPVPDTGTNQADIGWRDAVVSDQGGSGNITSGLSGIDPSEDTQLKSGEIIEKRETVRFSSKNLDIAAKKAEIEARFNELKIELIDAKKVELEWMGYEGNVS